MLGMPTMTKMIIFQTFPYRLRNDGYGNTADKRGSFLEYISTKRVSMQKLLVFIKMKWIKIEENRNRKKMEIQPECFEVIAITA